MLTGLGLGLLGCRDLGSTATYVGNTHFSSPNSYEWWFGYSGPLIKVQGGKRI